MNRSPEPSEKPKKFNPFFARSRAMNSGGMVGLEATSIGFTLVGFIVAGAGAGWLLDKWLGTNYWLPILFLVGVFGGFREMLATLKKLNQMQAAEKLKKNAEKREREITVTPTNNPTPLQVEARKRMFEVPPPPFEQAVQKLTEAKAPDEKVEVENVLEQMLASGDLSAEDLKELGFDVELPDADENK